MLNYTIQYNNMKRSSILPKEYLEVEYIQCNGTLYINTGFKYTQTTGRVEVKYCPNELNSSYAALRLGGAYNGTNRSFIMYNGIASIYVGLGGSDYNTAITLVVNGTYTAICDVSVAGSYKYILNDSTVYSGTYTGSIATDTKDYYIFCNNENGTAGNFGKYKLYYYKMYEAGVLVRHYIPCYRKSDGVIGLYDISGQSATPFYTNAGTGTFVAGRPINVLPDEYQEVEYIRTSGTNCDINTGIYPTNTSTYQIQFINYNTNNGLVVPFGCRTVTDYELWNYRVWNVNTSTIYMDLGDTTTGNNRISASGNFLSGTKYTLEVGNRYCKNLDSGSNIVSGTSLTATFTYKIPFHLFQYAYPNETAVNQDVILYGCRIYSDANKTILVRDFIPCYRKSDNIIGLYDIVESKFYLNEGTGAFIKGKDINYDYIYTSDIALSDVKIKYNSNLISTIDKATKIFLPIKDNFCLKDIYIGNKRLLAEDKCGKDPVIIRTHHLPLNSKFQEVEWISNNGSKNCYINTGVIPTATTGAEMDIDFVTLPTGEDIFFGARNVAAYASGNNYAIETNTNKNFNWCYKLSASITSANNVVALNTKYNITINKDNDGKFYYNNNYINTATGISGAGYGIGIFHCTIGGGSGSSYSFSNKRFYNVKLYLNGVLFHEYIPCYCTDTVTCYKGTTITTAAVNTIGMYDIVTNKFYINAGSDTFTKGPDV